MAKPVRVVDTTTAKGFRWIAESAMQPGDVLYDPKTAAHGKSAEHKPAKADKANKLHGQENAAAKKARNAERQAAHDIKHPPGTDDDADDDTGDTGGSTPTNPIP